MTDYHRMSIADKQAHQRSVMREPAVTCPQCETQTTPADLIEHVAKRCPGSLRDPGPGSKWINWGEARKLGVPKATMNKWVCRGDVRVRGEIQSRQYLLRDVATRIVQLHRRRKFTKVNRMGGTGHAVGARKMLVTMAPMPRTGKGRHNE